jgi:hypothetical protein
MRSNGSRCSAGSAPLVRRGRRISAVLRTFLLDDRVDIGGRFEFAERLLDG